MNPTPAQIVDTLFKPEAFTAGIQGYYLWTKYGHQGALEVYWTSPSEGRAHLILIVGAGPDALERARADLHSAQNPTKVWASDHARVCRLVARPVPALHLIFSGFSGALLTEIVGALTDAEAIARAADTLNVNADDLTAEAVYEENV